MDNTPETEPELPPLQAGRLFCAIFLMLLAATSLYRAGEPADLIRLLLGHFLFFGGIPAMLLLLPSADEAPKAARLRGLAVAALYLLFLPQMFCVWDAEELASDANAALGLVVVSLPAHLVWMLLALPWSLCRSTPQVSAEAARRQPSRVRRNNLLLLLLGVAVGPLLFLCRSCTLFSP